MCVEPGLPQSRAVNLCGHKAVAEEMYLVKQKVEWIGIKLIHSIGEYKCLKQLDIIAIRYLFHIQGGG